MPKGLWIAVVVILVVLLAVFYVGRAPSTSENGIPVADITEAPVAAPASTPVSVSPLPAEPVGAPTGAEAPIVSITVTGFSPATVSVAVGGSVIFMNDDTAQHQVASMPHPLHTLLPSLNGAVLGAGGTFTAAFTQAGTFSYHDHLNPGLTGTVVVR